MVFKLIKGLKKLLKIDILAVKKYYDLDLDDFFADNFLEFHNK